jgi:subtilase family serine protease
MSSRKRSARILKPRQKRSVPRLLESLEARLVLSQTTIIGPVAPTALGTAPVLQPKTAVNDSTAAGTQTTTLHPLVNPLENDTGSGPGHVVLPISIVGGPVGYPQGGLRPDQSSAPVGYTPAQLTQAYGVNAIKWNGSVTGNGAGETIAVIDAGDQPNFVDSTASNFATSDLAVFDSTFGLQNPPSFTKYNQFGGTTLPAPIAQWGPEISLDIEWAHSIAPAANIEIVEASNSDFLNLMQAANTAVTKLGASVVSMSFGGDFEYSGDGDLEQYLDSTYLAPALAFNPNVTFLASTGDTGADPGDAPNYPSISPLVVAVGGTNLQLTASNNWLSETGWSYNTDPGQAGSAGGGGISNTYTEPSFQMNDGFAGGGGFRTVPDVSSDADPDSGVAVYDSYDFPAPASWIEVGGTSLSSPTWAGLIAIADQGREVEFQNPALGGPTETLPRLYSLMTDK